MTFKAEGSSKKEVNNTFNMDIKDIDFKMLAGNIKESFKAKIQPEEKIAIRMILVAILILVIFSIVSITLEKANKRKIDEVDEVKNKTLQTISKIENDKKLVSDKEQEYRAILTKIKESEEKASGKKKDHIRKDALPNFLNQLAHIIPIRVKVTKIVENNSHITMTVESEKYEQLGYFTGLLENDGILLKIKTSASQKEGDTVKLTIEGDLP